MARKLQWYGDELGRVGFPDCLDCFDYMQTPGLVEACASVGIEHNKDTGEMLRAVTEEFHTRGHPVRTPV